MIVASIDLGTNSFKCMIATLEDERLKILFDDSKIVRIGQDIEKTGLISKDSLKKADGVLNFFSRKIKKHKATRIKAVATSAARESKNLDEFIELINSYNMDVSIISGKQEGALSYKGAVYDKPQDAYMVIDIGGGSTEIAWQDNLHNIYSYSLNMGALRFKEKYVSHDPIASDEIKKISSEVYNKLSEVKHPPTLQTIGVGGTINTLLRLKKKFNLKQSGNQMSLDDLSVVFKKISSMNVFDRTSLALHPKRADIIVTGNLILIEILKHLGITSIEVSYGGVRLALAAQMLFKIKQ